MKQKITKEMEQYILENYMTQSREELLNNLGGDINMGNLSYYLSKHNLLKKKNMFTDEDIEFMKAHYKDMEYKEIAKVLGFTERQIRGKINNMGLNKVRNFNDRYFQYIDTSLKAYFLGYIYADGWVIYNTKCRNYEFGMELQIGDKYILDKLNEELGGVHIVTTRPERQQWIVGNLCNAGKMCKLRVYSQKFVKDLIDNGIKTNKTLKPDYPIVDDRFFFDWLRGYIDGDGCFYNGRSSVMHITCSHIEPLEYIHKKLKEYNIKTSVYKCEGERKYRIYCCDKQSMSILVNHLYYDKDVFCLSRKFDKVKKFIKGFAV